MKLHYNLSGGQTIIKQVPVYGNGAAILEGAAVMRGATPGTNQGFAIVATGALAKVIGVMNVTHALVAAGLDSKQDATAYTYLEKRVIVNPDSVFLIEHTTPTVSAIAVASTSTTTVTITSLEDDIDGGWLWGSDNQLQYLTSSASGSATTKTATGWTSATKVTKIHQLFGILIALDATAVKIANAAAAGSGKVAILESYIHSNAVPRQRLDPTKHSGITYDSGIKIFQDVLFTDHMFANNT